ncbi:MAG: glutathione-disulfide reductase [Deltaproteobacteria bacterium]|nr:glutathione-disulfide reductase [Deltaproteobacteria bacterium]MBV8451715.1 glutathione-disulfide reductase [Deltaproteobacteria bacterium]
MPQTYDFDLFTIGAGSGGVRASRIAAGYGAKVAVAEERYLGGTCVNVGCIPKKLLVYASEFSEAFEDAAGFGWNRGQPAFDWPTLIANKDREIERLNGVYERLLTSAGAQIIRHQAQLLDAHTVAVNGQRLTARYILVATGSWPTMPPFRGVELAISSNEAFHLPKLPARILIVGGGYISVEFAGIFHGLGAKVTQVHRGPLFLRGFDDDLCAALADEMRKRGIALHFGTLVNGLEHTADGILAVLSSGARLEVDLVMCATGRHPNSAGLGLENAGVELDRNNAIVVNEYSQTSADNIYAVGDVTNRRNLTPVAIAEGHAVADLLFGNRSRIIDHASVPSAVFSQPPIATVGLTEAEGRARYGTVEIYKSIFRPLKHTLSGRDERTLMKLVVEPKSGCVIGAHMLGPDAGEIIQGLAIALKCGATKAQFDATIGIHPTAAEEFVTMREKS